MPFSFQPVPSVKQRVEEAFQQLHLTTDSHKHLFSFLLFSFSKAHGLDGDGSRARVWDGEVVNRLAHITRAIIEAVQFCGVDSAPSEALMGAIALRDTPDQGVQGLSMLGKYPEALGFVSETNGIYREFRRVNDCREPDLKTFQSVGTAAQFLTQLHALDVARRTVIKLSAEKDKLTPYERNVIMSAVNRYRPLMAALGTPMCLRYRSMVNILDKAVLAPQMLERAPAEVIYLDQRRPKAPQLVKT